MSGFLTHLASFALGRPVVGAARPSLPPRYAAPEVDAPVHEVEEPLGEQRPAPARAAAAAKPPDGALRSSGRGSAPPVAPPGAPPSLPASEAFAGPIAVAPERPALRPPDVRHSTPPRRPAGGAASLAIAPDVRPEPHAAVRHAAPPRRPAGAAAPLAIAPDTAPEPHAATPALTLPPPALVQAGEPGPVRAASVQAPRRAPPPSVAGPTPLAPLSDGAVAGRTEAYRRPAPVIHVTIDRIEVRAPAPPRPAPAARRAPAEPSLSLSDFLATGSPGPRQ